MQIPCDVVSHAPDTQSHSHTDLDAPPSDFPRIPDQSHTDFYHNPGSSFSTPSDAASVSPYMQGRSVPSLSSVFPFIRPIFLRALLALTGFRCFRSAFLRRPALIRTLLFTAHGILLKGIFEGIEGGRGGHALGCQSTAGQQHQTCTQARRSASSRKRFQPMLIRRARFSFRPKDLYPEEFDILVGDGLCRFDTRIESAERTQHQAYKPYRPYNATHTQNTVRVPNSSL